MSRPAFLRLRVHLSCFVWLTRKANTAPGVGTLRAGWSCHGGEPSPGGRRPLSLPGSPRARCWCCGLLVEVPSLSRVLPGFGCFYLDFFPVMTLIWKRWKWGCLQIFVVISSL